MAEQPKKTILQQIGQNLASMYRPGEFTAIGREALKDIQSTYHEVMFGKPGHVPEPGTPLNPTPQIVTAELLGKPLTPGGATHEDAQAMDMAQQTTLDKLRGFASERTDAAQDRMGNAQKQEQEQGKERGGLEM